MKNVKKKTSLIMSVLFLATVLPTTIPKGINYFPGGNVYATTITSNKTVKVTTATLNKSKDTLTVGNTDRLTLAVAPSNATNKSVTWTSSNKKVATVVNGIIKAVSAGTAKITATTVDGKKTASCTVTVNAVVKVTSVKLNKTADSLKVGDKDTLTATINPSNAANKNVTWKSSNVSVVKVDNTGKITAVSKGSAKITVTTADGSKTAASNVTVTAASCATRSSVGTFNNDNIVYAPANLIIQQMGGTVQRNEADKFYIFTINGKSIRIDETWNFAEVNGEFTPYGTRSTGGFTIPDFKKPIVKDGNVYVPVDFLKSSVGLKLDVTANKVTFDAVCAVKVTSLTINKTEDTLTVESTDTLEVAINPSNATNKSVTWTSSNTKVATVVDGVIKAVSAGTAKITATTVEGKKTASCTVTVNAPVQHQTIYTGSQVKQDLYGLGFVNYNDGLRLNPKGAVGDHMYDYMSFSVLWKF